MKNHKKIAREFFLSPGDASGHHGLMERIINGKKITTKKITTPRGSWLLLPSKKLADHVVHEYESVAIGKRFFSPLAMTIIDNIMLNRAAHDKEFLASLRHDTILFIDDSNQELLAYLTASWQPLWSWAEKYFGTALPIVYNLQSPSLSPFITDQVKKNTTAWHDWLGGAVYYLSGLLQSPMIAIFALHHDIGAESLFAYSFAEQEYQAKKWGIDAVAQEKRIATINEIKKTQEFIKLVTKK